MGRLPAVVGRMHPVTIRTASLMAGSKSNYLKGGVAEKRLGTTVLGLPICNQPPQSQKTWLFCRVFFFIFSGAAIIFFTMTNGFLHFEHLQSTCV